MTDLILAQIQIRYRGVSLAWYLTALFIVIALYLVFRWRKFGEDAFTWNHEYAKRAFSIGLAVWVCAFTAALLLQPLHVALFWSATFVIAVLALSYWADQELLDATILSLLFILIGLAAKPVSRSIDHFLYGIPGPAGKDLWPLLLLLLTLVGVAAGAIFRSIRPSSSATSEPVQKKIASGVPRLRSFILDLPDGWREIPGKSQRTYTRQSEGSGVLQVSLQPPLDHPFITGADVERELSGTLDSIGLQMPLGQRLSLSHESCALGILAFADYQTEKHGLVRFWLIPAEVTIFASYTDGKPTASAQEIAEAHATLKAAKFEENHSTAKGSF